MSETYIDVIDENIVIRGDISKINSNRLISNYIKKELKGSFINGTLQITYNELEKDLEKVYKIFEKLNIEPVAENNANDEIMRINDEKEKFVIFSKKAKEIRNNNCDTKDFASFIEVVKNRLVGRQLYTLQLLSAYHLAFSQNACNFSVPGTGKTSVIYGAYAYLNSISEDDKKYVNKIVVIGPLSSFAPWENEYEECFNNKIKSKRLTGIDPKEKEFFLETDTETELVLISYQGIINCKDSMIKYLKRNKVMIILDEAHKIKNTDNGVIANTVLSLALYANSRAVLTGTPLPNGYEDLYNLFKFIWPEKEVLGFHSYQLKDMTKQKSDKRIEKLVDNISSYYMRIKKTDLENMPEPIEIEPVMVKMDTIQKRVYESLERKTVEEYIKNEKSSVLIRLRKAKLIRLMQVASNPGLLIKPIREEFIGFDKQYDFDIGNMGLVNEINNYADNNIPNKFIATENIVRDIIKKSQKVIIWCTFVENIIGLSTYLQNVGIENRVLYGGIPVSNSEEQIEGSREKIISDFHKNDSKFNVIIANPHAVGESISLHKVCHNAIYFERSFNATHFLQSRDRIHRYGLKKNDEIKYYYLITEGSIDEIIHKKLWEKKLRMEEVIEKYPIPLFDNVNDDFGDEEIRMLVKKYVERTSKY